MTVELTVDAFCSRGKRTDIDDEDDQESYFNAVKDGTIVPYPDDEDIYDYDSDGNPIAPERSRVCFSYSQHQRRMSVIGFYRQVSKNNPRLHDHCSLDINMIILGKHIT